MTIGGLLFIFGVAAVLFVAGARAASGDQTHSRKGLIAVAAAGAAAWLAFIAVVPHENGGQTVFGMQPHWENDSALWLPTLGMIGAAAVAGWRHVAAPIALGAAAIAGAFAMAYPTSPRGDGDGLWGLVFLALPIVGFLAAAAASMCGAAARTLSRQRS